MVDFSTHRTISSRLAARLLRLYLLGSALALGAGCGEPQATVVTSSPIAEDQPAPPAVLLEHDPLTASDRDVVAEGVAVGSGTEGVQVGSPTNERVRPPEVDLGDRPPPSNRPPTAIVPANVVTDEDVGTEALLTAIDDHDDEAELHVEVVTPPAHGALSALVGTAPLHVTFTPDADFAGADTFTVAFTDTAGARSAPVAVPIIVHPANDAPRLTWVAPPEGEEGTPYHHSVVVTDPEGDDITVTLHNAPAWLQASLDSQTLTFSGSPTAADVGEREVVLHATDGWAASTSVTFTLRVRGIQDPPAIEEPTVPTSILEDQPFSILLRATDPDDAGPPAWTSTALPGWAQLTDYGDGTALLEGTPDDGDQGMATFAFVVTDETGLTAVLAFDIEVVAVNDAPIAETDHFYALSNIDLSVTAGSGQVRVGGALTQQVVFGGVIGNDHDPDTAGRFAVPQSSTTDAGGTVTVGVDGSVAYQPPRGFLGDDHFTYRVRDTAGAESEGDVLVHVARGAWFVDPTAPSEGEGTWASPTHSLGGALALAEAGDTIFVRGTSLVPLIVEATLPEDLALIGEGAGLTLPLPTPSGVDVLTLVPAGPAPTLSNPVGDILTLADRTTVAGFTLSGAAGTAIVGPEGVEDVVLSQLTIDNSAFAAIHLSAVAGTWQLQQVTVRNGARGLVAEGCTALTLNGADVVVESTTLEAVALDGIGGGSWTDLVVADAHGDGVRISNASNASLTFDGADITTAHALALHASDVGQLTFRASRLSAANQGALHLARVGLDAELDEVTSEHAPGDALFLYDASGSLSVATLTVDQPGDRALVIEASPALTASFVDAHVLSPGEGIAVSDSAGAQVTIDLAEDLLTTSGDALLLFDGGAFTLRSAVAVGAQGGAAIRATSTELDVAVTALHASGCDVGIALDHTAGALVVDGDGTDAPNASGGVITGCSEDATRVAAGRAELHQMRLVGAADRGLAIGGHDDADTFVALSDSEVDDHAVGVEVDHDASGLVAVLIEDTSVHTTAGANVAVTSSGAGETTLTLNGGSLANASGDTSLEVFRTHSEGSLCLRANGVTLDKRLALTADTDASLLVAGYHGGATDNAAVASFLSAANGGSDVVASAAAWPTPVSADACALP